MNTTTNYSLYKPEVTDPVDITKINDNMDTLDTTVKGVSNVANAATPTASIVNDFTRSVFHGKGGKMSENSNLLLYDKHILTSPFGMRIHPVTGLKQGHNGTDYGTFGKSPPIYSPFDGKVLRVGKDKYGALFFYVDYGEHVGLFYHCSKIIVKAGQTVKAGQIIAYVGSTGRSTGEHLHFGWIKNNERALDYYNADYEDFEKYEAEMVKKIKVEINGVIKEIDAINKNGHILAELRDLTDLIDVDYDAKRNLPILRTKK